MKRILAAAALGVFALVGAPSAHADQVAYLVNVHGPARIQLPERRRRDRLRIQRLRPGRGEDGLRAAGRRGQGDFNTADYYQGAYLINQAVNELCPAQIWQLRQSAAGYTLPA